MTFKIAAQIQTEQNRGRKKYGKGPEDFDHDDSHTAMEWQNFIFDHAAKLTSSDPADWRKEMVKIAGLAVSAIESYDRKRGKMTV